MPIEAGGDQVQAKPNTKPSTPSPLEPVSDQCPPAKDACRDTCRNKGEPDTLGEYIRHGEIWLIGIGVATILVNIVIGAIYYSQLKEMRQATKLTGDAVQVARDTLTTAQKANAQQTLDNAVAAIQSRVDSDRSAAYSLKSLQATVDNFHQDQSAWLGICGDKTIQFEDGKPIILEIKFCNTGRTPAKSVSIQTGFEVNEIAANAPAIEFIKGAEASEMQSVPPQGSFTLRLGDEKTSVSARAYTLEREGMSYLALAYPLIKTRQLILYNYGKVQYLDAFGHAHKTTFCVYLADPNTKMLMYCEKYNEMD